jgi:hypothetical protein
LGVSQKVKEKKVSELMSENQRIDNELKAVEKMISILKIYKLNDEISGLKKKKTIESLKDDTRIIITEIEVAEAERDKLVENVSANKQDVNIKLKKAKLQQIAALKQSLKEFQSTYDNLVMLPEQLDLTELQKDIGVISKKLSSLGVTPVRERPAKPNGSYRKIETGGGGDCFFHSVAYFIPGDDHLDVRRRVVEYYIQNRQRLAKTFGFSYNNIDLDFSDYIAHMSLPGNWAEGQLEMLAVANIYGRNVEVHTSSGQVYTIEPDAGSNGSEPIRIFNESQRHFVAYELIN